MAATAAAGVCLFAKTTAPLSPPDTTSFQGLRFHPVSSWMPMPLTPFTSIRPRRLHTPTSSKLFSLLQETAIQEESQKDIADPETAVQEENQKDIVDPDSKPEGASTSKLYVNNLPFSCDAAEVRKMFEGCGKVRYVELIMERETGRSRGYAFVTMGSEEDARIAIREYDKYELGGRVVNVRFANSTRLFPNRRSSDPDLNNYTESPNRIYCGNLAWTVTSRSLRDFFKKNGNVVGAKVMYEPQSGRSLGYGFVSFVSKGDVKDAIASHNGKDLEGRPVQLRRVKRTKKSATEKNSAIEENSTPQEIVKE